jgi:hypothetical protein
MSSMRQALESRLQPPYLRLVALAILAMGVGLAIYTFATDRGGESATGIPWGADFAGFYVAGQLLDAGETARLYDRPLHAEYYHRLLPKLPKDEAIPYVHPPFVAGAMQALTRLPYTIAVWVWMAITLALYSTGVLLVVRHFPTLWPHRWLVLLLACSFQPFLFECWIGGQLSAVGFFSVALCFHFNKKQMPLLAGIALGLCFYKPTLLLLLLPMLLIGRQWLMLAGMTLTGLLYLALSLLMVGWDCTFSYVDVLLNFKQQAATGQEFVIRHWKYTDLNHFFKTLIPNIPQASTTHIGIVSVLIGMSLIPQWWRSRGFITDRLWAATLLLIPIMNVYFGIYDVILIVQAAIILNALEMEGGTPVRMDWKWCLLALFLVPWFTQYLARYYGLQLLTLVLMGCAYVGYSMRTSPK